MGLAAKKELVARGLVDAASPMHVLVGGRTNALWQIGEGEGSYVCKFFLPDAGTTLFPNDSSAEIHVLQHLSGTGIAPLFEAVVEGPSGPCLVYRLVEGEPWRAGNIDSVAQTTRKLHQTTPPPRLREIPSGSDAILKTGDELLAECSPRKANEIRQFRPASTVAPTMNTAFVHGDLVPANIICQPGKDPVFIDWQCPAIGDPCEDLSTFLSPAMQALYGSGPLSIEQETEFLNAYGDRATIERLSELRMHFHYRMAAHCLWKAQLGDAEYEQALVLEIAALEKT